MRTSIRTSAHHGRLLIPILLLVAPAGCARTGATRDSATPHSADAPELAVPVPVRTAVVAVKTMPLTLDAVGSVEAISTGEIRSQVTGQLREVHFAPGREVKKGEPLFTLDARPFEAAVRRARAVVSRDIAQLNDAKAQRSRFENLFNRGLIPRDQFETQTASAAALEATLAADQAQLDQVRLNLQYTRITAPIDGRTGTLMGHVGDLIRANDTSALVTINQLSPVYVTFSVPARLLVDIRRYAARGPLAVIARGQLATLPGAPVRAPSLTRVDASEESSHSGDLRAYIRDRESLWEERRLARRSTRPERR